MSRGVLIAIEGTDGSGKETQARLLMERLKASGYQVALFDFPRYDFFSGYFVSQYLNGYYGSAKDINPYASSIFYAVDRFAAKIQIEAALKEGKIAICNRYVGSNMAHQGSKFDNPTQRHKFFLWNDSLEFTIFGIPRPALNIVLKVPAATAYKQIGQKTGRNYTKNTYDEHEADLGHLKASVLAYDELTKSFPEDFKLISCMKDGELLSVPAISNLIWKQLGNYLPSIATAPPHKPIKSSMESGKAPSFAKKKATSTQKKTPLLHQLLDSRVTDIVTGFPENTNAKDLYLPTHIATSIKADYTAALSKILETRQSLINKMTTQYKNNPGLFDDLIPLALKTTSVSNFRPVFPADVPKNNKAQARPYATAKRFITQVIPHEHGSVEDDVTLISYSPRNELDILKTVLFSQTDLPMKKIQEHLINLSYNQKAALLKNWLREVELQDLGLETTRYEWEIIASVTDIIKLRKVGPSLNIKWQQFSPRYGFEIPGEIEEAGLFDDYEECFSLSLQLFSKMQESEDTKLAQYAVLLGAKNRVLVEGGLNSISLLKDYDDSQNQSLSLIIQKLLDSVLEKHPLIIG